MTHGRAETLRFVLTAPLVLKDDNPTAAIDGLEWEWVPRLRDHQASATGPGAHLVATSARLYSSRFESAPELLAQQRSARLPPTILLFDRGHGAPGLPYQVVFKASELRRAMRSISVCLAEVETPAAPGWDDVSELEDLLSVGMQANLSFHGQLGTAGLPAGTETRWVARCRQVAGIDELAEFPLPERWLNDAELAASASDFLGSDGDIVAGWGNSIILDPVNSSMPIRVVVRDATVDAQILWNLLESIDAKLQKLSLDDGIPLKAALLELEGLEEKRLMLHFAVDEVGSRIQGPRRRVAEALLASWGFRARLRTVDERFDDVRSMLTTSSARGKESYQNIVELLLVFIGVLAVGDLVLSAAQLAYSGGVDSIPGEGSTSRWLILAALRQGDVDFLLLIAGVASLIMLSILLLIRVVSASTLRHRIRILRARKRADRQAS